MEESPLKRFWLFFTIIGFSLGIFLASFNIVSISGAVFFVFIGLIIALYGWRVINDKNFRSWLLLLSFFCILAGLGVVRFVVSDVPPSPIFIKAIGEKFSFVGVVSKEPRERASYREYIVKTNSGETVLVRADLFPNFSYGDKLVVRGTLSRPEPFETIGGRMFDYERYLRKEGISFVASFANAEKIGEGGFSIRKNLFSIKRSFISAIERAIPDPESALLSGILLGSEESLDKELLDAFRIVGIIHIIVLSGYNITIVAEAVMRLMSFLSRRKALVIGTLGIVLFAIMVGGGPSVVRASVMAILVLIARFTHRTYAISRSLLIAGFVMIAWNPYVLSFDLGFQLSFLATIAIIWIAPLLEKRLGFITERFGLRDIASATLATQIFVLPLLVYASGTVSISGFIVNLLVLPFIPSIMFVGFFTGLIGVFSSGIALIPGVISYALLTYVVSLSSFFASLPLSAISIGAVSFLVPVFLYLCWIIFFAYQRRASFSALLK